MVPPPKDEDSEEELSEEDFKEGEEGFVGKKGGYEIDDDDDLDDKYPLNSQSTRDEDVVLFDKISPMDIVQGELGDCWLLSAFASMAEYPAYVEQIIEDAGDGTYLVHLHSFKKSDCVTIAINDSLPETGNMWIGYELAYVNASHQNEIWTCVLEKAFAKLAGGYDKLDGGYSWWAFACMTGCLDCEVIEQDDETDTWKVYPIIMPDFDDPSPIASGDFEWTGDSTAELSNQQLIQKIQGYDANKYLMCVASNAAEGMTDHEKTANNIHYGHAYTVLQVADRPLGYDFHLIKLRNPWGSSEFKGPWSDGSDEWTQYPDVAEYLEYKDKKDGAFWMPLDDFDCDYHQIFVCKKDMSEEPHIHESDGVYGKSAGVELTNNGKHKQNKGCLCQ